MTNAISLPQYLIESSVCLICFYTLYHVFFRKETFFQFNRFYLLGTAMLSLLLPFLNFSLPVVGGMQSISEVVLPMLSVAHDSHSTLIHAVEQPTGLFVSVGDIIRALYLLGAFIMGLKLLKALFNVFGLISKGQQKKEGKKVFVSGLKDIPASSFFSYIFWNDNNVKSEEHKNTILNHEFVHVRQWHSLDVILMEIMVILKWFNPLIYLFRNHLKLTHEYIADQYVSNKTDKLTYANILLTHNTKDVSVKLNNTFYSNIKARLVMLGNKKSSVWKMIRYALIIPVMIGLMGLFSFNLADQFDLVADGYEDINEGFAELESKTLLSLPNDNQEEDNSEDSKMIDSEFDYHDLSMFFKWGVLQLAYKEDTKSTKGSAKYFNVETYNRSNEGEAFYSLLSKPLIYVEGMYWADFSFDLVIENADNSFSKRIDVNDAYTFDTEEIGFKDIELIHVSNLKINTIEGERSYSFSFYVDEKTDSSYFPVLPVAQGSWVKQWSEFHITQEDREKLYLFKSFDDKNTHSTRVESLPAEELVDEILYSEFELKNNKTEEEHDLSNMNLSIVVRRTMVVDEAFKNTSDLLPESIVRTYNTSKNKEFAREQLKIDGNIFNYKNMIKKWVNDLDDGDMIYLAYSNDDSSQRFNFQYVVQNSTKAFEPRKILGKKYKGAKDKSNYQIIYRDNAKTVVKTDINNPENEKIVKSFQDESKYDLVHIPNFETEYRILEYEEVLKNVERTIIKSSPVIDEIDALALPEFTFDEDEDATLIWGRMRAEEDSGNYSMNELHRSRKKELKVKVDSKKNYVIARFTMYIIDKEENIQSIQSSSIRAFQLNNILKEIDEETVIYFDDIIISDEGKWYHLMDRFSFVFE